MMTWSVIFPIFIIIILTPLIITGTTSLLSNKATKVLVRKWGDHSQIIIGAPGVILHELGHVILAKIFRHKIRGFRLIQFRNFKTNTTLGYVNHTWDVFNFYQNLGNFFIGIAPFFSCTGFLVTAHYFLVGTHYNFHVNLSGNSVLTSLENLILNCFNNITCSISDDIYNPKMALIFALLVLMVSITGYGLSKADWNGAIKGVEQYLIVASITSVIIIVACFLSSLISQYVWNATAFIIFLMVESWLYVIFSVIIVVAITLLIHHGL